MAERHLETKMSARPEGTAAVKITAQTLMNSKRRGQPISAVTAYDCPTARLADEAGIEMILVGDSLGMVVLGFESTLPVTIDEMLHHARAVRRGVRSSFLVVDMPYGSYHTGADDAVRNALRLMKEGGAAAVKLEGGADRAALVERLTREEIPVVGHIGLTPQAVHRMGGYRVQGRSAAAIDQLMADAAALEGAGAVALVLEGVPREVAARLTAAAGIPTIGIGAGPECDGQILVLHDMFQLGFGTPAKFVRAFGDAGALLRQGFAEYRAEVAARSFPAASESYHLAPEVRAELEAEPAGRTK